MKRTGSSSELVDTTAAQWIARRDAGLTATETAELSRWLEQDDSHAAAFARFEATWSAVGRPRRTGAAVALAGELAGRQRRRRSRGLGAASALAVVMLVAGYLWNSKISRDSESRQSQTVLLTPEIRTLSDGSIVELKRGAEISVEFTPALRRVQLVRGEAHFAVAKNPAWPFVVASAGIEVRAVGTAFLVNRRANSVGLIVTEGRVAVERPPAEAAAAHAPQTGAKTEVVPLAFVEAGNQVEIESIAAASSEPLRVTAISASDLAERLAWRAPRAEFSGTPLAEVVSIMNRHGPGRFVIEDPALARVPLSGLIWLEDRAAFLRLMETGFGVQADKRDDGVIVLRKSER
ncbi:MAG: anti-FecI sigma factor, FecR [Verrucomicrobia bacterium]|nr:anti-FecI sigma factor, FecR [Verrucomicrobiota bacterium]